MKIFLLTAACILYHASLGQTKMVMTVKEIKSEILGYAMDPDGSGNKQSISLFGPMQNSYAIFQYAYQSTDPINSIVVVVSNPGSSEITIKLSDVTVYAIKEYVSAYSNGIFNISSTGNANTELKCKFKKIEIQQGSAADNQGMDNESTSIKNKDAADLQKPWDIVMDSAVTGIGGTIFMQLPKSLSYSTHMEFYEASDSTKRVASWFGNNKARLKPGLYDVVVDDKYTIRNVPVETGKRTRLRMGVFKVTSYGTVEIESSNHQKFSTAGPFSKLLPEGTYYINGKKKFPVVIKDGEVTEL